MYLKPNPSTSIVLAAALLAGCWLGGGNARAQDHSGGLEQDSEQLAEPSVTARAYAEEHRISVEEAVLRESRMQQAGELQGKLQDLFPDTFAGLYIEHEPVFQVVVMFTRDARALLASQTQEPWYVARIAPRSLELLESVQEEIVEQLEETGIDFTSSIDIIKSEINVNVRDPEWVSKKLSKILSVAGFVKINKANGFVEPVSIVGGRRIRSLDNRFSCTAGFNVVNNKTRELGVLTAGHCPNNIKYSNPDVKFKFMGARYSGPYDLQWHTQPNGKNYYPQENVIKSNGGPKELMDIKSISKVEKYFSWRRCL